MEICLEGQSMVLANSDKKSPWQIEPIYKLIWGFEITYIPTIALKSPLEQTHSPRYHMVWE